MSYFITALAAVVFFFIVLKKRIVPALMRLLKGLRAHTETEAALYRPSLPEQPGRMHFEVLAFFMSEAGNSVELRERIEMRLGSAVQKLEDMGISFDIQYMAVGDALVIIISGRKAERSSGNGNGRTGSTADGNRTAGK